MKPTPFVWNLYLVSAVIDKYILLLILALWIVGILVWWQALLIIFCGFAIHVIHAAAYTVPEKKSKTE